MKKTIKAKRISTGEPQLFIGYQWGEPPNGQSHFLVSRIGEELEITAAMPEYMSETSSCDLLRQYEIARKNRSIGKQRTGKDSPHIRFANADSDDDLIDFVRDFGPVVSKSWKLLPFVPPPGPWRADDPSVQNFDEGPARSPGVEKRAANLQSGLRVVGRTGQEAY